MRIENRKKIGIIVAAVIVIAGIVAFVSAGMTGGTENNNTITNVPEISEKEAAEMDIRADAVTEPEEDEDFAFANEDSIGETEKNNNTSGNSKGNNSTAAREESENPGAATNGIFDEVVSVCKSASSRFEETLEKFKALLSNGNEDEDDGDNKDNPTTPYYPGPGSGGSDDDDPQGWDGKTPRDELNETEIDFN